MVELFGSDVPAVEKVGICVNGFEDQHGSSESGQQIDVQGWSRYPRSFLASASKNRPQKEQPSRRECECDVGPTEPFTCLRPKRQQQNAGRH